MTRSILLVDDDQADSALYQEAFQRLGLETALVVVHSGSEALDYLRRFEGNDPWDEDPPRLALLDLHMPNDDGLAILRAIRGSERHHRLPVVMFTGSEDEEARSRSYELRANAYLKKPDGVDAAVETMRGIVDFWLVLNRIPS